MGESVQGQRLLTAVRLALVVTAALVAAALPSYGDAVGLMGGFVTALTAARPRPTAPDPPPSPHATCLQAHMPTCHDMPMPMPHAAHAITPRCCCPRSSTSPCTWA